jgi:chaperone BCS1
MRVQPEKLDEMAEMFADKMPEEVFSPAEIQGRLLVRKNDQKGAPREVKWREEQIK